MQVVNYCIRKKAKCINLENQPIQPSDINYYCGIVYINQTRQHKKSYMKLNLSGDEVGSIQKSGSLGIILLH